MTRKVWPVKRYSLPEYTVEWTGSEDASGEVAAALARQSEADEFSTHMMTQVNKLRDQGIVGKGVKVAVVDSGVSLPP